MSRSSFAMLAVLGIRAALLAALAGSAPDTARAAVNIPVANFQGAWAASVTYETGAVVTYQGASYICISQNTHFAPVTHPGFWIIMDPAGATGAAGPTGPQGPAGTTGPPGATGAQGPAGVPGPVGPAGPAGARGLAGAPGQPGVQGVTGATGATGPPGTMGATGPQGPVGPQGAQGLSGPAGPVGPPGTLGVFGSSLPRSFTDGDGVANCIMASLLLSSSLIIPQYYTVADGRLLPINQNQALYSLIGTTYGGDGVETFALPDLRSATPNNTVYLICIAGIYP